MRIRCLSLYCILSVCFVFRNIEAYALVLGDVISVKCA